MRLAKQGNRSARRAGSGRMFWARNPRASGVPKHERTNMTASLTMRLALTLGLTALLFLFGASSHAQEIDNPSFDEGANSEPMARQDGRAQKQELKSASAEVRGARPGTAAQQVPAASQETVVAPAAPVRGWIVALVLVCLAWSVVYARTGRRRPRQFENTRHS